jgi:glucosamine--fructose-6-phosphate aminotransferase (isomerizing)
MCGIVGIASNKNCIHALISGLKCLEYRGYDSSGIATSINNRLSYQKSKGKISNLIEKLSKEELEGNTAIAHTRWATHGKPNLINAHPFIKENCALVHNGIVENYEELIKIFSVDINTIESETDTEVIAEIYSKLLNDFNNPVEALKTMMSKIEGTFAFAFLIKGTQSIYAARKGSPIVVGLSDKYNALSSDLLGLPDHVKEIIFLKENDILELNNSSFSIFNLKGEKIEREIHPHSSKNELITKGNFKHFMQKEIYHQPMSIDDTVLNFTDRKTGTVLLPKSEIDFNVVTNLHLVGCGTAFHACMIAKYWFEQITHMPTSIDIGSEYRYRQDPINKDFVGVAVSQSGETMDTLECLKKFNNNGLYSVSIVNVINSTIARESNYILPTIAGPEIGVASTKAFTSQLIVLALFSLYIQQQRKISNPLYNKIFYSLFDLSKLLQIILENTKTIKNVARTLRDSKSIFYIGRGTMYPLALEGALKLKEITYKHCEGYAAGELKHGPLALIEKNIPVIVLAPCDNNFTKLLSNVQEIKAREGKIIMITDKQGVQKAEKYSDEMIILPNSNIVTAPIIYSLPIQMIAYYLAVLLGTDIDQPRNLAKSVTVE